MLCPGVLPHTLHTPHNLTCFCAPQASDLDNSGLIMRSRWTQQWADGGNTVELELPTLIFVATSFSEPAHKHYITRCMAWYGVVWEGLNALRTIAMVFRTQPMTAIGTRSKRRVFTRQDVTSTSAGFPSYKAL